MVHEIDGKLLRLDPPVGPEEEVMMAISGVHKDLVKGPPFRRIHGFGIVIRLSSGRKVEPITYVSKTETTTHMRAELGAVLTTCQWRALNAAGAGKVTIIGKVQYSIEDLPKNLRKWMSEPASKRENYDLISKIYPFGKHWVAGEVRRFAGKDEEALVAEAKRLAQTARDAIVLEDYGSLPEDDFDIFGSMTEEDEFLMRRAMDKDPYG